MRRGEEMHHSRQDTFQLLFRGWMRDSVFPLLWENEFEHWEIKIPRFPRGDQLALVGGDKSLCRRGINSSTVNEGVDMRKSIRFQGVIKQTFAPFSSKRAHYGLCLQTSLISLRDRKNVFSSFPLRSVNAFYVSKCAHTHAAIRSVLKIQQIDIYNCVCVSAGWLVQVSGGEEIKKINKSQENWRKGRPEMIETELSAGGQGKERRNQWKKEALQEVRESSQRKSI